MDDKESISEKLHEAELQIAEKDRQLKSALYQLEIMRHSWSWRITSPLRFIFAMPFQKMALLREWYNRKAKMQRDGNDNHNIDGAFCESSKHAASTLESSSHGSEMCLSPADIGVILADYKNEIQRNSPNKVILIIDHDLGGGANAYRNNLIRQEIKRGAMVILFVSDFFNKKYNKLFFYYANETRVTYSFLDLNMLITLFQNINISEVIMNVLVSHWEPLKILSIVKNLKEQYGFKIIVPVHDFFLICPNFNLLDYKEKYCDIPSLDQCRQCLEKYDGENRQFIVSHDIKNWRGKWFDFLRTVDQITCFSNSSLDILKKAYPTIEQTCNVTIQPHIVDYIKPRTSLNIGVLGEIKLSKGSGIIWDILEIIKKDNLDVNITVIGTLSSKNINSNNLTVTGRYDKNEIAALVKRHDIDIFFVPSIWPETFSYTTEEIIKMNMPIAVFNLGAPAERVKRYHKGLIIENIDPRSALDALLKWRLLNPF